jgi:carboxypeptidase Taq
VHPFTGGTAPTDVRLTTRLFADTPLPALFGTIHEAGHGLYEQGFAAAHYRTPLAQAPSMGLHESQSRLWENMVGRSPASCGVVGHGRSCGAERVGPSIARTGRRGCGRDP